MVLLGQVLALATPSGPEATLPVVECPYLVLSKVPEALSTNPDGYQPHPLSSLLTTEDLLLSLFSPEAVSSKVSQVYTAIIP